MEAPFVWWILDHTLPFDTPSVLGKLLGVIGPGIMWGSPSFHGVYPTPVDLCSHLQQADTRTILAICGLVQNTPHTVQKYRC